MVKFGLKLYLNILVKHIDQGTNAQLIKSLRTYSKVGRFIFSQSSPKNMLVVSTTYM